MANTLETLSRAKETLSTARLGLTDVLSGRPERRLGGVRNLIVFGRAVTNVLQNLRSTEPTFDAWYQPFVDQMRADPLLRYFYQLRSEILKEGKLPTDASVHIHNFSFPGDIQRLGPPPAGAKSFFIGDQSGGSGWEVELPNGTTEKFYVDIPGDLVTSAIHLPEAPESHLGNPLPDKRIETLSRLYFDYIERMFLNAQSAFPAVGA